MFEWSTPRAAFRANQPSARKVPWPPSSRSLLVRGERLFHVSSRLSWDSSWWGGNAWVPGANQTSIKISSIARGSKQIKRTAPTPKSEGGLLARYGSAYGLIVSVTDFELDSRVPVMVTDPGEVAAFTEILKVTERLPAGTVTEEGTVARAVSDDRN